MAEMAAQAALPTDEALLNVLEQSVSEVFSMMVCSFEAAAVYRRDLSGDRVGESGGVHLVLQGRRDDSVHIDREAVVEFRGALEGRVVLRCSADGALDIARGMLMLQGDAMLAIEEVNDALKECANMLTGSLKTKPLDPPGDFKVSIPFINDAHRDPIGPSCGALVYRLQKGLVSLEIWRREKPLEAPAA